MLSFIHYRCLTAGRLLGPEASYGNDEDQSSTIKCDMEWDNRVTIKTTELHGEHSGIVGDMFTHWEKISFSKSKSNDKPWHLDTFQHKLKTCLINLPFTWCSIILWFWCLYCHILLSLSVIQDLFIATTHFFYHFLSVDFPYISLF